MVLLSATTATNRTSTGTSTPVLPLCVSSNMTPRPVYRDTFQTLHSFV